jgi:hypothetical protein
MPWIMCLSISNGSQVEDCRYMAPWASDEWLYGPQLQTLELDVNGDVIQMSQGRSWLWRWSGERSYGENEDDSDF